MGVREEADVEHEVRVAGRPILEAEGQKRQCEPSGAVFADHLLGWEPLNEWDAWAWTLNAEGNGEPGRETEMRRRAVWLHALNDYVRQLDPDRLVFSSTAGLDPRGPIGRAVFYDRSFDVLVPHFYTNSSEEPINNPASAAVRLNMSLTLVRGWGPLRPRGPWWK